MKYKNSQNQMILEHLIKYKSITPQTALNLFGCMRLASRCFELKQQGHNIETEIISNNGKRFANYYLS